MPSLTATSAWIELLTKTLGDGEFVSPRGRQTRELPQQTICVDMRRPVVIAPDRKLNYKFMAAEAFWILTGDDRVENIAPYNKHIAQFSDDGEKFFGAYGPKVTGQMDYVVRKLREDSFTRQAGLTIWRENPPPTKDYPCTIAMFFQRRGWSINCHVFMRSSDQWLGVPYDIFNFSCITYAVCAKLNMVIGDDTDVRPGALFLTAASSHLYEENWEAARHIIMHPPKAYVHMVPRGWYVDTAILMRELEALRNPSIINSNKWWEG